MPVTIEEIERALGAAHARIQEAQLERELAHAAGAEAEPPDTVYWPRLPDPSEGATATRTPPRRYEVAPEVRRVTPQWFTLDEVSSPGIDWSRWDSTVTTTPANMVTPTSVEIGIEEEDMKKESTTNTLPNNKYRTAVALYGNTRSGEKNHAIVQELIKQGHATYGEVVTLCTIRNVALSVRAEYDLPLLYIPYKSCVGVVAELLYVTQTGYGLLCEFEGAPHWTIDQSVTIEIHMPDGMRYSPPYLDARAFFGPTVGVYDVEVISSPSAKTPYDWSLRKEMRTKIKPTRLSNGILMDARTGDANAIEF